MVFSFPSWRPNQEKWKPVANASDRDHVWAYEQAANKIGVKIKIGFPVPCSAGSDYASGLGMKGIYILRDQSTKENELSNEMFKQLGNLSR